MAGEGYTGWLDEVRICLDEINMTLDSWQHAFPFDFEYAYNSGLTPLEAAKAANEFWWNEQDKILPPHLRRRTDA